MGPFLLIRLRFHPLMAGFVLVLFNHALATCDPSSQVLVPSHDQYIYEGFKVSPKLNNPPFPTTQRAAWSAPSANP